MPSALRRLGDNLADRLRLFVGRASHPQGPGPEVRWPAYDLDGTLEPGESVQVTTASRKAPSTSRAGVAERDLPKWVADPELDALCAADWRRPGAYWRCVRQAGHRGRHRMRRRG
jgi:hypothetical protein